jgi:hypothetical protein
MGRPPIGERALTAAEKMRRYRARLQASKPAATKPAEPATKPGGVARMAGRREELGEFGDKSRGEIAKLKSDNIKLKMMLQEEPDAAKLRKKVTDLKVEIAALRREVKVLAKERDKYQKIVRAYRQDKYKAARETATRENYNLIIKALHADVADQATPAHREAASRLVTRLRPLFDYEG